MKLYVFLLIKPHFFKGTPQQKQAWKPTSLKASFSPAVVLWSLKSSGIPEERSELGNILIAAIT